MTYSLHRSFLVLGIKYYLELFSIFTFDKNNYREKNTISNNTQQTFIYSLNVCGKALKKLRHYKCKGQTKQRVIFR